MGASGYEGCLYASTTAIMPTDRGFMPAATHNAAEYTITFCPNGGVLCTETNGATATLGCVLPDCIPTPIRKGYLCKGWKDANGLVYYGEDGEKQLSSYAATSNVVLYAEWAEDPEVLVISPADGTVFTNSLTVSMSSSVDGAAIHYTLDGSEPTADSDVYKKKFRIYEKTTVKAIVICEGWTNREAVVVNYAPGRCPDPVVVSSRGCVFTDGQSLITIVWDCEDGVLRYTTDGSEVNESSPEYVGSFSIDATTTIKTKAFGETYFDSEQTEILVTREWVAVETPVIEAAQNFTGSKNKVVITCATGVATVYYTLDGSDPTPQSIQYDKPFCVTDSCVIKAIAVKDDYLDSAITSLAVERQWSIGSTMGKCDHSFSTGGDAGFVRTNDLTAALGESMRSGEIEDGQMSTLSTTVVGSGTISFKWRTSCEDDVFHEYDHAEFVVDGEIVAVLDGITPDWEKVTKQILGEGEHLVVWRYVKDSEEKFGEDCMWISEYEWTSDYTETQTTDDPIPYSWLMDNCCDVVDEYDSYEKVARQMALNGRLTVGQCYVAGLDPESTTNDFSVAIDMVDGAPHIKWNPDLKAERVYKIFGKEELDSTNEWIYPTNAYHRFFKVTVEMP